VEVILCNIMKIPYFSAKSFAFSAFDSVQASRLRNFNQLATARFAFRVSILSFQVNFNASTLAEKS